MARSLEEMLEDVLLLMQEGWLPGEALHAIGKKYGLSEEEKDQLYDLYFGNLKDVYGGCARYTTED